jgi:putative transposase
MSIASQSIYHIVFSTFNQEDTITKNGQRIFYKYIWELLKKRNCELYRINGTSNHVHLAIQLHYLVPLDALIKDIQQSTTTFVTESHLFPDFAGWEDGYFAVSHSFKEKNQLVEYVKNQEEVHSKINFKEEIDKLKFENGIQ